MTEIEVDQGVAHACHHGGFEHLGTFDEAPEELASESNTVQAQEDITQPGKTAGKYPRKLYVKI